MTHLAMSTPQHVQFWMDSFHIGHKWSLAWEGMSRIMTFDLDPYLTAHTVQDGFFPHWAQMISSMRGCVAHNDLWPWVLDLYLSFSHEFAMKVLKYVTYCRVCSTVCTILDGFFPYLAYMITSMRGCVARNDLWPWHVSSSSFSHDFAIHMYI